MMTSWNGDISASLALCVRDPPVTSQRPVTRSFDVFLDLRLNKRLSKQSKRCWFDVIAMITNENRYFELLVCCSGARTWYDDVIKWKHFPRYWPFVRGIHRSPANSPRKGQWRGALMFSLIYAWLNGWVNTREAGDMRRYRAHYDAIVMSFLFISNEGDTGANWLVQINNGIYTVASDTVVWATLSEIKSKHRPLQCCDATFAISTN